MMKFEHKAQPVISRYKFFQRILLHFLYSWAIIAFSLCIGTCGYHYFGEISWLDAFLNASMILTGMGPVNAMQTALAKVFAALYALYSGIAFLSIAALLFAPFAHRLLHMLHLDYKE
jgi:hypothetical protein